MVFTLKIMSQVQRLSYLVEDSDDNEPVCSYLKKSKKPINWVPCKTFDDKQQTLNEIFWEL